MSNEAIIEKIQKLIHRGNNSTSDSDQEAANALRLARKLMVEYDINDVDLLSVKGEEIDFRFLVNDPSNDEWSVRIWSACAKLYFCKVVRKGFDQVGLVGRPHHTSVCREMILYLQKTLKDNLSVAKKKDNRISPSGFKIGWAISVTNKIESLMIDDGDSVQERALVVQEDEALSEYMKNRYSKKAKIRNTSVDHHSYSAGIVSGSNVSLNTQIH